MSPRQAFAGLLLLALTATSSSCLPTGAPRSLPQGILVSMALLDRDASGEVATQPARLGVLTFEGGGWRYRSIEDADSNVFHKAMAYAGPGHESGVLTLGGSRAIVKLWSAEGGSRVLWEADFGGKFSRMRDAEVADLFGDGGSSIVVATHDQGVVEVLRADEGGRFSAQELDRQSDTFVHEIEIGDLDGDGTLEVYATPSAPNKLDGTPQPGQVVRYVPARGEGRTVVADLGERHAKEILVADVDGDGRDELYVSVEAVSGGTVTIRRYDSGTPPRAGRFVAELSDTLCRFLTAGDVDGDGHREMVAATRESGLWLLRPAEPDWTVDSIDRDSSGFEHAAILADLDENGIDELYVASDQHDEIRRYTWRSGEPVREVLYRHTDGLSRFTWNLTPVPVALIPRAAIRPMGSGTRHSS